MSSNRTSHVKKTYRIASIPADGIGPEVVAAAIDVLNTLAWALGEFDFQFDHLDWGTDYYKKHGKYIPEDGLATLKQYDAILFGSVGSAGRSEFSMALSVCLQCFDTYSLLVDVPDYVSLWGLRLSICQPFQQYANVRPIRVLRGVTSPLKDYKFGDIDWVIVRENSEGEYAGHGGRSHVGLPWEVATEVAVFTRHGTERLMHFAFEIAKKRSRRKITVVTKSSAQRHGMVLWDEVATEVAKSFPAVEWDQTSIDAMTARMVLQPDTLDTIAATNLHATILSNLAAALAGSVGIAPTSNIDPTRQHPSMFEPMHGTAADIVGKGIANPVATYWTAAEMVRWLGHDDAAESLLESVENVCERGIKTKDVGGNATTKEVTLAVCRELEHQLGFALVPYPSLRKKVGLKKHKRKLGFETGKEIEF